MSRVALAIVSAEKLDAAKVVETRPEDTAAFHAAIADYIARNFASRTTDAGSAITEPALDLAS